MAHGQDPRDRRRDKESNDGVSANCDFTLKINLVWHIHETWYSRAIQSRSDLWAHCAQTPFDSRRPCDDSRSHSNRGVTKNLHQKQTAMPQLKVEVWLWRGSFPFGRLALFLAFSGLLLLRASAIKKTNSTIYLDAAHGKRSHGADRQGRNRNARGEDIFIVRMPGNGTRLVPIV